MIRSLFILFIVQLVSALNTTIPFPFPLFSQCNEIWADDLMDTKTICSVGCLMSSTAMAIAGSNILIKDNVTHIESTPRTLNQWLRNNNGYGKLAMIIFCYIANW